MSDKVPYHAELHARNQREKWETVVIRIHCAILRRRKEWPESLWLSQDGFHDLAFDVGQPIVASLKTVG
jgi:hypothetical protein